MDTRSQQIEQLCRKYQVRALYVFGSRSVEMVQVPQDDAHELKPSQSDLDVGILAGSPLSIDD